MYKPSLSPYQVSQMGMQPILYCPTDIKIIRLKIEYMTNLNPHLNPSQEKILETHKSNLEFVCRQLNQQMIEGIQ